MPPIAKGKPTASSSAWNDGDNTNSRNFLLGTGVGLIANIIDIRRSASRCGYPLSQAE
ncbi:MAG: hypothetical protein WA949_15905 [Phormidesmis sp.]